jgi:hypothetical protein
MSFFPLAAVLIFIDFALLTTCMSFVELSSCLNRMRCMLWVGRTSKNNALCINISHWIQPVRAKKGLGSPFYSCTELNWGDIWYICTSWFRVGLRAMQSTRAFFRVPEGALKFALLSIYCIDAHPTDHPTLYIIYPPRFNLYAVERAWGHFL